MKILLILFNASFLMACDTSYTIEIKSIDNLHLPLEHIIESPSDYSSQVVLVKGITSEVTKTPLGSLYKLTDLTGSIWVQTEWPIPQENSAIYLTAKVESVLSFRDSSLGLHLIEVERELQ